MSAMNEKTFLEQEIRHKERLIANTEKTLKTLIDNDSFINQLWRLMDEKEKLEQTLKTLESQKTKAVRGVKRNTPKAKAKKSRKTGNAKRK